MWREADTPAFLAHRGGMSLSAFVAHCVDFNSFAFLAQDSVVDLSGRVARHHVRHARHSARRSGWDGGLW